MTAIPDNRMRGSIKDAYTVSVSVLVCDIEDYLRGNTAISWQYGEKVMSRAAFIHPASITPYRDRAILAFMKSKKVVSGKFEPGKLNAGNMECVLFELGLACFMGEGNPCPRNSLGEFLFHLESCNYKKAYANNGEIICFIDSVSNDFDIHDWDHWASAAGSIGAKNLILHLRKGSNR